MSEIVNDFCKDATPGNNNSIQICQHKNAALSVFASKSGDPDYYMGEDVYQYENKNWSTNSFANKYN